MTRGTSPWSPDLQIGHSTDLHGSRSEFLERLKRQIESDDPAALYQAIVHCNGTQIEMPTWLTERLLHVISGYFLGKKPGEKGQGKTPLARLRRRLEQEIRYRAVLGVREWQRDRTKYQLMPKKSIEEWIENETVKHAEHKTMDHALRIARIGLDGLCIREGGLKIKCSEITLKRAFYSKELAIGPKLPVEAAVAFGFNDPDTFFGTDLPLPPNLE